LAKAEATPVRFLLRYDPVMLELVRRVRSGFWGDPVGASVQAVASSADDAAEILAALVLAFGKPVSGFCSRVDGLIVAVLVFGNDFALSAELSLAPAALGEDRPFVAMGSLNCRRTLMEFRLGTEKTLAYAGPDSAALRLPLAEGDGARYRSEDLEAGSLLVTEKDDGEALELARKLLSAGCLA
jgi:hypothetical protein